MLISSKHNFIFIHIPKTGGSSIKLALEKFADERQFRYLDGLDRLKSNRSNKHGVGLHEKLTPAMRKEHKDKMVFAVVRNSWDWHGSIWRFHKNSGGKVGTGQWEDYIQKVKNGEYMYSNQFAFFNGDVSLVDKFIRFEDLENGFKTCLDQIGLTDKIKLEHHNNLGAFNYKSLYTPEQVEIVREVCKDEIKHFGWTFE